MLSGEELLLELWTLNIANTGNHTKLIWCQKRIFWTTKWMLIVDCTITTEYYNTVTVLLLLLYQYQELGRKAGEIIKAICLEDIPWQKWFIDLLIEVTLWCGGSRTDTVTGLSVGPACRLRGAPRPLTLLRDWDWTVAGSLRTSGRLSASSHNREYRAAITVSTITV